ncbi:MAG: hypothetical protein AAGB22_12245, partial [Bacteroidota bacterium]
MKKLWAKVLLAFVLPLYAAGQQDPCSINAGGNQIVCFDDTAFTLNGSIGSNVDPTSLSWTPVPGFTITPSTSEVATVTASGGGNLPQGTYTFQLNGQCLDGTPLQNTTVVTVTGMPTQAEIFHNGVPTNQLTVCTKVNLTGSPVAAGENWAWFPAVAPVAYNQQDDPNSPATCIRYNTSGISNCSENTLYYEINNGGCATIDS